MEVSGGWLVACQVREPPRLVGGTERRTVSTRGRRARGTGPRGSVGTLDPVEKSMKDNRGARLWIEDVTKSTKT